MVFRRLVRSLNHPLRSPPPPLLLLRRNNKSGGDQMWTCKICGFRDTKHNVYRHRALHDAGLLNQKGHPTMLLDPDLRNFYDTKLTIMPKQSELHKEYDYAAKKYEGEMVRIFTFESGKWSKVVHAHISLQCLEDLRVMDVMEVKGASQRKLNACDFLLRVLALVLTLAAAIVLGVAKQTKVIPVQVVQTLPPLNVTVTAKWHYLCGFV